MEFYYQIKGKKGDQDQSSSNWAFPPIFSGKVVAENRIEARKLIDEQYQKTFPTRVLNKDIESNDFLLSMEEIKPDGHIKRLFEPQECVRCKNTFYVIDKYNDLNESCKNFMYCSSTCSDLDKQYSQAIRDTYDLAYGKTKPVIYKITNKITSKVYIGKTSQIFTLRWYQHFFQTGSNKFHDEIKKSKLDDWQFEIIEVVEFPDVIKESKDFKTLETYIFQRERHWIDHFNSIEEGYNSI